VDGMTPILIKCYGDGLIEIYGEKPQQVSLQIVDVPFIRSNVEDLTAEAWADAEVRLSHKSINYPSNKIGTHCVRSILPSEIHKREVELGMARELRWREYERGRRRRILIADQFWGYVPSREVRQDAQ
jgi:hypothetical protein